jgi:hypothetical protein
MRLLQPLIARLSPMAGEDIFDREELLNPPLSQAATVGCNFSHAEKLVKHENLMN